MKLVYVCSVVAASFALGGCITTDSYLKEYKQVTGMDINSGEMGRACSHWDGWEKKTPEQLKAANLKCAEEASGKPFISDQVISYSELKDGYQLECFFGGYDRNLILDRLSKGVGLVQPVYLYGDDGAVMVDWPATERLIALAKNTLKLNVRPVSDSRAYDKRLSEYRAPQRTGTAWEVIGSIGSDPIGNKHYTEVISKLTPVDYIIAPSQDVVDAIFSGEVNGIQAYFKLASSAKNADDTSKKTFKPQEIQGIIGFNEMLKGMIYKNSQAVKLDFQLTERMKAFNEKDQSYMQRMVAMSARRGCNITDMNANFAENQVAKAEVAGANNKTFAQRLTDMVQIDTSRGLEISLSNEQAYRDQFLSERKKLSELKAGYMNSMHERYQKVNGQLTPFAGRAFQQFKVTGFTQSKKL